MVDRDLAELLHAEQERQSAASAEPTLDDVVDGIPAFDESAMPDPFSELPRGMG